MALSKAIVDTEKKPVATKALLCGVVPVRFAWGDWHLLVLRTPTHWDFPSGRATLDEDLQEAAIRETTAKTGIADLEFVFGEDFRETVPYAGNTVGRYYVAETRLEKIALPVSPALGRPEHDEWQWVTCEAAEDLLPPRLAGVLEWVRQRINE